jgi:hypothetical protein
MANATYMNGRKKYGRPQGMLWAENSGIISDGKYVPNGYEVGYDDADVEDLTLLNQFIILSDHNRSPIDFSFTRIEQRQRMINGRMRSLHVADKMSIKLSWSNLPSRSFASNPDFTSLGSAIKPSDESYTVDGGAGGNDILDWYQNHPGSFWVYLSYDRNSNFAGDPTRYNRLGEYNQIVEMYIADFSYTVEKRGASNHDLWNIQVSLEEV